jgi:FkbM family methyltransferase
MIETDGDGQLTKESVVAWRRRQRTTVVHQPQPVALQVRRPLSKSQEPELKARPRVVRARTRLGSIVACRTDDQIQRHIYSFGVWEPDITRFIAARLRPGDAFIDVGANIGYYSLLASRLVGSYGRVAAVEPSLSIRAELLTNLAVNGATNVRVISMAASDSAHSAVLYRGPETNRGASTICELRGFGSGAVSPAPPSPNSYRRRKSQPRESLRSTSRATNCM